MVTPLVDRDTLDAPGLARLIEHLLTGGVHGLFILGTTGEGPSLGQALRRELITATVERVSGRVPVLVAISDTSLADSIELARFAADAGADAVVSSAPFYFRASQEGLLEYVWQLADTLPLPLLLYNMPQLTKVAFEPETVRQALEHKNIVGVKDSSGDMVYFHLLEDLIAARQDKTLFMGPEEVLADAILAGANGGVCGGANMFPRLYVELYEAGLRRDFESVKASQDSIMQVSRLLYSVNKQNSSIINGIKCTLSWLGICHDYVLPPLRPFNEAETTLVYERLKQLSRLDSSGIRSEMIEHSLDSREGIKNHTGANSRLVRQNGRFDTQDSSPRPHVSPSHSKQDELAD